MKICIVQKKNFKNPKKNIDRVIELVPKAIEAGGDIICFSEWFLGTNPADKIPNKFTDKLSEYAQKYNKIIVTGNFRIQVDSVGRKFVQVSCIINQQGEIIFQQKKINLYKGEKPWFLPGSKLEYCNAEIGNIVVTSGLDSINDDIYDEIKKIKPSIWIAQANEEVMEPKVDRYEELRNLIKRRSSELGCLVICPMMLGNFYGSEYKGRSYIVENGNVVKELDNNDGFLLYDIK